MKRKLLLIISAILVLTMLLSACDTGNSDKTKDDETEEASKNTGDENSSGNGEGPEQDPTSDKYEDTDKNEPSDKDEPTQGQRPSDKDEPTEDKTPSDKNDPAEGEQSTAGKPPVHTEEEETDYIPTQKPRPTEPTEPTEADTKQPTEPENTEPEDTSDDVIQPDEHVHKFDDRWERDEEHHWHPSNCGHPEEISGYAPHNFDEGVVNREPGCYVPGSIRYTCVDCGEKKYEETTKREHSPVTVAGEPATCTSYGKTESQVCEYCESVLVRPEDIRPLGHNYYSTQWYVNDSGETVKNCANGCEEYYIITSLGAEYTGQSVMYVGQEINRYYISVRVYYNRVYLNGYEPSSYSTSEEYTLDNDYIVTGGGNVCVVTIGNVSTEVTIPTAWDNLPGTNDLSEFEISGNRIVKYIGTSEVVTVPARTEYNTITYISSEAFKDCSFIKQIVLTNNITTIDAWAFSGCSSLESVDVGDRLELLGKEAFVGCSSLKELILPDTLTYIFGGEVSLVEGCTSLKKLVIGSDSAPEPITILDSGVFKGCTSLEEVYLGSNTRAIGREAFMGCTSLTSLTMCNNLMQIAEKGFMGCTSLSEVSIPGSVTKILAQAFDSCTSLSNVEIGEGVEIIGGGAFYNNTSLKTITIPSTVKELSKASVMDGTYKGVFRGCTSLEEIIINTAETSEPYFIIGNYAFAECSALESITLGGVKSMSLYVFDNCTSLTTFKYNGSVAEFEALVSGGQTSNLFDATGITSVICNDGNYTV